MHKESIEGRMKEIEKRKKGRKLSGRREGIRNELRKEAKKEGEKEGMGGGSVRCDFVSLDEIRIKIRILSF